jgi:hypothetical protein
MAICCGCRCGRATEIAKRLFSKAVTAAFGQYEVDQPWFDSSRSSKLRLPSGRRPGLQSLPSSFLSKRRSRCGLHAKLQVTLERKLPSHLSRQGLIGQTSISRSRGFGASLAKRFPFASRRLRRGAESISAGLRAVRRGYWDHFVRSFLTSSRRATSSYP